MSQDDPNPSCVQCGIFIDEVSDMGLCYVCEGSREALARYERELGARGALRRLYFAPRRLLRWLARAKA